MPITKDYTITFACYNQINYTRQFIDSLDKTEVDFSRIVAIDNGSTDGTREWLQTLGLGAVVLNNRNLGCGVAWNQGALALQSTWTVVMNNDVICAKGWLDGLLHAANEHELQIVSPGMVEGALDYNFADWAKEATQQMRGYCRRDVPHAVCMAIHQDVWDEIGYFLPIPKLLGYEDALFFQQAELGDIRMGTTADSWLHHFGSITQKSLKLEKNLGMRDRLGNRSLARVFMNQSWLERKLANARKNNMLRALRDHELATYQMTVHMLRQNGEFEKK